MRIGRTAFATQRVRIVGLAAKARLPTIYFQREAVVAGGLASYGPDIMEMYRHAADFVDKILKGASPGGCRLNAQPKSN